MLHAVGCHIIELLLVLLMHFLDTASSCGINWYASDLCKYDSVCQVSISLLRRAEITRSSTLVPQGDVIAIFVQISWRIYDILSMLRRLWLRGLLNAITLIYTILFAALTGNNSAITQQITTATTTTAHTNTTTAATTTTVTTKLSTGVCHAI